MVEHKRVILKYGSAGQWDLGDVVVDPGMECDELGRYANALWGADVLDACWPSAAAIPEFLVLAPKPQERYLLVVRAIAEAQTGKVDREREREISSAFMRYYGGIGKLAKMFGIEDEKSVAQVVASP